MIALHRYRLPAATGSVTDVNYHLLPGYVGNPTGAQLQNLDKLKEELKDQGLFVKERIDVAMLLRWLSNFFYASDSYLHASLITKVTLASAEKRRKDKDFKVDEIVKFRVLSISEERQFDCLNPTRNLEFTEKKKSINTIFSNHKMDKVRHSIKILAR